jgi:drug/metabolite transporter (DMT)-like permease
MRTHEPVLVSAVGALFGTFILTVICFLTSRLNELIWINTTHLYLVIYWAVAQAFGSLLFFAAMRRLEAPRASVFMFMIPLTATFLSVASLGERITPQFIAGSILIIIGITLAQWRYVNKTKN